mgnify:FL=1
MFKITEKDGRKIILYGEQNRDFCLIQPTDASDEEKLTSLLQNLSALTDRTFCYRRVNIPDWNDEMSPWPAPAVFGEEGFSGGARATLEYIENLVPYLKSEFNLSDNTKFILGGYSLAGLFSLWRGYESRIFSGIRGASPSVWFPDWDKFTDKNINADYVYLSLGDRERKTKNKTMCKVEERIEMQKEKLVKQGVPCTLEYNPGNHFKDADIRTAKAFARVINNL